ncbi:MAG TPA: sulfotransferase [Streptosporangiaceae bacterium]|jgi:hypothetical protein
MEQPVTGDPVFVLCGGRSGSTLLRFVLDAHPDLACPPETNVPALCGQLATVWSLIEGAPLSQNRGDEPPEIPDAAIAGVRDTMDRMVGSYLERRGKKRYCDKSLGTARFAYLMQRIWPNAKFLCLYRHPMDVIASGVEACPWGLNGYGFDQYVAETPGNTVFALARFWLDNEATIHAAEEQYGDRSHRVRYEDMVSDPEGTANGIYDFLGVHRVPDIAERIFSSDRERHGPADYKIWHTSKISADSVGRGWTVPAGLIPLPARENMNRLAEALGYLQIDDAWGTSEAPADMRVDTPAAPDAAPPAVPDAHADDDHTADLLAERLRAGLARLDGTFTRRWGAPASEPFTVVATPPGRGTGTRLRVDPGAATLAPCDEDTETAWDLVGTAETWQRVIRGEANLSVVLRRNELRYLDTTEGDGIVADTRIGMLSDLLGLAAWDRAAPGAEVTA